MLHLPQPINNGLWYLLRKEKKKKEERKFLIWKAKDCYILDIVPPLPD